MPHICHITTAHLPNDTRIFRRECVSLARSGYRVSLIARHDKEAVSDGVECIPLPKKNRKRLARILFDTRMAARIGLSLQADLYHFHDPELVPAMRWLSRRTLAPVVWDVHEYYFESIGFNNSLRWRPLSRLAAHCFSRLELASCRRLFGGVVTISETMARRYQQCGKPVAVVGNYPDLNQLPQPRSTKAQRPLLVSMGAQFGPKGAFQIADAYRKVRERIDCDLAFWGTFHPPVLKDELKHRTQPDRKGQREAIVEGPVPWHRLMAELLPQAWLGFVLFDLENPNYRLGLPNRLFEMWAVGVPAIVTDNTEVARLVRQHDAGVAVPDNRPDTLADAAAALLRDPSRLAVMSHNARRAVETTYNWAPSFDHLLALYRDLGVPPPAEPAGSLTPSTVAIHDGV